MPTSRVICIVGCCNLEAGEGTDNGKHGRMWYIHNFKRMIKVKQVLCAKQSFVFCRRRKSRWTNFSFRLLYFSTDQTFALIWWWWRRRHDEDEQKNSPETLFEIEKRGPKLSNHRLIDMNTSLTFLTMEATITRTAKVASTTSNRWRTSTRIHSSHQDQGSLQNDLSRISTW